MSDRSRSPDLPRPAAGVIVFLLGLAAFLQVPPARGANVMDLVQDTPAIRKKYRMEIEGFSSEAVPSLMERSPDSGESMWLNRGKYEQLGETEKADGQLEGLVGWRLERGRQNLAPYAVLLIREAYRKIREPGDRARTLLGYAVRLAPDYPAVHFSQGFLALRKNILGVTDFIQGLAGGTRSLFQEAYRFSIALGNLSLALALIIVITASVWTVSLLVRYAVQIRHDLEESLGGNRRLHAGRRLATALVMVAVIIIFASPLWLVVLGLFLTWAYQKQREKLLSVVLALLLAGLPLVLWVASATLAFLGNDLNQALMAFRNGSETPGQAATLENSYFNTPGDDAVTFSLAQHYWRQGDNSRAGNLYLQLREGGGPLKVEATVNLGNILMTQGNLKEAATLYRDAIAIRPDNAAAHFNLGLVYNLQFQFQEGEQELKQAMSLDKMLISVQPAGGPGAKSSQSPITENLPLSMLLGRMRRNTDIWKLRAGGVELWNLAMTGVPATWFPGGVALLGVLGAVFAGIQRKRGLTRRCAKCGRPFCSLCLPGANRSTICPQCQHIFMVKEGIESSMRMEKMLEIKAYHSRQRLVGLCLAVLLPGGGHIFFGRPVSGLILASASAAVSLAVFGVWGPFIDRTWLVFPWMHAVGRVFLAGLCFLYLVNLVTAYFLVKGER